MLIPKGHQEEGVESLSLTFLLDMFHNGFYQPGPDISQMDTVWALGCQRGNSDPQDTNSLEAKKESYC